MKIKKSKNSMNLMPYVLLAIVIISSYLFFNTLGAKVNELTYTELMGNMNEGKVDEVIVTPKNSAGVYVISGKLEGYKDNETFTVTVPYTDTVISDLYKAAEAQSLNVETNTNPENSTWLTLVINVLPIIIFGVLLYTMFIKLGNSNKGSFDFGKSKAKLAEEGGSKTFKDVA